MAFFFTQRRKERQRKENEEVGKLRETSSLCCFVHIEAGKMGELVFL